MAWPSTATPSERTSRRYSTRSDQRPSTPNPPCAPRPSIERHRRASPTSPHACAAARLRSAVCCTSDEALDELQGGVGDLVPAAVDRQGVAAVGHLDDLGHARVAPLLLVLCVHERPWDR